MKKKKTSTKKIEDALDNSALINTINNLSKGEVVKAIHSLRDFIYSWKGNPTRERIEKMSTYSFLDNVIDFKLIYSRLEKLEEFNDEGFGVHISDFMPELDKIYKRYFERFRSLSNETERAELLLWPIAKDAGATSDVEAAIYFASRNNKEIIDTNNLKNSWYETICNDILRGNTSATISKEVKERAESKTISLAEASEVLKDNPFKHLLRFFSFFDQEEDFIDATFFRAVEWFNITGFEPWIDSFAHEASIDLTNSGGDLQTFTWLFHWCRSDLAINKIEKVVLQAALLALIMNGPVERSKPWRQPLALKENINTDYIFIAGILPFIWHRVNPSGLDYQVITKSLELLFQAQMVSGGWPDTTTGSKPDIMSTCFAIHGLATAKPNGWEKICKEASEWLMAQQKDGYWRVDGEPTVMITVLVLDSINLANNSDIVTFRRNKEISYLQETPVQLDESETNYDIKQRKEEEKLRQLKKPFYKKTKYLIPIILAVFGAFPGYWSLFGRHNNEPHTKGDQSPAIIAGGDVDVNYGVPPDVVKRLLEVIDEKDVDIAEKDAKIRELIEKDKKKDIELAYLKERQSEINMFARADDKDKEKRISDGTITVELATKDETSQRMDKFKNLLEQTKTERQYSFDDWYYKGATEFKNRDYSTAIISFKKALEAKPDKEPAAYTYNYIGAAYGNSGSDEEALEAYKKSITLKPDNPLPHTNIAFIYLEQGHIDRAEEEIKITNGLLEEGKLKGREKTYAEETIMLLKERVGEAKKKRKLQNEN